MSSLDWAAEVFNIISIEHSEAVALIELNALLPGLDRL